MTLDELKASVYDDEFMEKYYERFRNAMCDNEPSVSFRDVGTSVNLDDRHALNSAQVQILRNKGYKVEYNKFVDTQWEISGWLDA